MSELDEVVLSRRLKKRERFLVATGGASAGSVLDAFCSYTRRISCTDVLRS